LALLCGDQKGQNLPVKYWEQVADKLSKAGWSLGWVSTVDSQGRVIWTVDAHRDNGKRFVVQSDERSNQALQRTADRRENFQVTTSTFGHRRDRIRRLS
jgi:hypothetical protein